MKKQLAQSAWAPDIKGVIRIEELSAVLSCIHVDEAAPRMIGDPDTESESISYVSFCWTAYIMSQPLNKSH